MNDKDDNNTQADRQDVSAGRDERQEMATSSVQSALDLAEALERVGGDTELLREIATIFLDEFPGLMLEIRQAVQSGDALRLERAAHSLKGSVSNFGAEGPTQAALAMELIGRQNRMREAEPALKHLEAEFGAIEPALRKVVAGEL